MDDIIALSGWAMPHTVFDPLGQFFPIQAHALPGVARWSGITDEHPFTCADLVDSMSTFLPEKPITLIGWSLGGVLAAHYAHAFPDRVSQLILTGCNPCFVKNSEWPHGMDHDVFLQFVEGMRSDVQATLKKFFFLNAQGAQNTRVFLRNLYSLLNVSEISFSLLYRMLLFLQEDIRRVIKAISCPVTFVFAKTDALVPVSVVSEVRNYYPESKTGIVRGSHLFFREYPEKLASIIASTRHFNYEYTH